jgi:hypothetical protein
MLTQAEFNKALQTIQEIECGLGIKILKLNRHLDDGGRINEASWTDADGYRVLVQRYPFTPEVEYEIHEDRYNRIVYQDYWK